MNKNVVHNEDLTEIEPLETRTAYAKFDRDLLPGDTRIYAAQPKRYGAAAEIELKRGLISMFNNGLCPGMLGLKDSPGVFKYPSHAMHRKNYGSMLSAPPHTCAAQLTPAAGECPCSRLSLAKNSQPRNAPHPPATLCAEIPTIVHMLEEKSKLEEFAEDNESEGEAGLAALSFCASKKLREEDLLREEIAREMADACPDAKAAGRVRPVTPPLGAMTAENVRRCPIPLHPSPPHPSLRTLPNARHT